MTISWRCASVALSFGGCGVGVALAAALGVAVEAHGMFLPLTWFFGEVQGRDLLACADAGSVIAAATEAGLRARAVGRVGADAVRLGADSAPLADLSAAHKGAFARLMGETA